MITEEAGDVPPNVDGPSVNPAVGNEVSAGQQQQQQQQEDTLAPNRSAVDSANEEISRLLSSQAISQAHVSHLQAALRENLSLKDKVAKLKELLAKSSKATRDVKAELDTYKRALDKAQTDMQLLNLRVHALSNRHTHLDLIADFDKNFERAMWTLQHHSDSQSGGEDPSSFSLAELEHHPLRSHEDDSILYPIDSTTSTTHNNNDTPDYNTLLLERISILEGEKQTLLDQQAKGMYNNVHTCELLWIFT